MQRRLEQLPIRRRLIACSLSAATSSRPRLRSSSPIFSSSRHLHDSSSSSSSPRHPRHPAPRTLDAPLNRPDAHCLRRTVTTGASPAHPPATMTTDLPAYVDGLRAGQALPFPPDADTAAFARRLDEQDKLRHLRDEFLLPTKASLKKRALDGSLPAQTSTTTPNGQGEHDEQAIYFVGNSLGAQPRAVRRHLDAQLETWASLGVNGHFTDMANSPLTQWQDLAESCARASAAIVGCSPREVVVMNTLTVNLHLMMASFYRPAGRRRKVLLEWKPFPSDHYAIESHIRWRGLDPAETMVKLEPDAGTALVPTERVLRAIDEHADEVALLLLPGIQYYSGQLFDMATITAHAKARGIVVGWDLAHAAGNVELRLHDWGVDFACWCTYKYLNAGPGAIAGVFVHERHGGVEWTAGSSSASSSSPVYHPRLTGWYGGDKSVRFNMDNLFVPTPGAAGFQLSNPSAIDLASLAAALSVFAKTSMRDLRSKALVLTAYAEHLLHRILAEAPAKEPPLFRLLTPSDPSQRGTQLSLLLREGLLDRVARALEENGVACDKRKPDVIRIAPVPLYCSFSDVWKFMRILRGALEL